MKLVLKEKKAKEVLERIIKDLNKRFDMRLIIEYAKGDWISRNGIAYDSMYICYEDYCKNIPLIAIHEHKTTYARMLSRFAKYGMPNPRNYHHPIRIDQMYGNSYEEIMMNLDLRLVE